MASSNLHHELKQRGLNGARLAALLGVNKSSVSRWINGKISAERVPDVERVAGIPRHVLRPDLWPASPKEAAE
jgi:DNA-binding transcriptional regulator YdaS (Cro superfamily)